MRTLGIVGCGVVGGVLAEYFHKLDSESLLLRRYDPPKGFHDDLSSCDAVFISVPVDTNADGSQDLSHLIKTLNLLSTTLKQPTKIPIFIRSTVLPGTCDLLANGGNPYCEYALQEQPLSLYAMPEFLTERTASDDFLTQPLIVGGRESMPYSTMSLLRDLFPNKPQRLVRNVEAELIKYTHNCFAAVKVNFFNLISEVADDLGVDYSTVRTNAVTVSGYFTPVHTLVPGPDGKTGFGGKCLPKDLKAFLGFLKSKYPTSMPYSIKAVDVENDVRRVVGGISKQDELQGACL